MLVCLCLGVTDRQIEAALSAGARDICHVGRLCGAGTCCGGCRPEIARMLSEGCPFLSTADAGCRVGATSTPR